MLDVLTPTMGPSHPPAFLLCCFGKPKFCLLIHQPFVRASYSFILYSLYEFSAWYAMFGQGGCVLLGFLYYGLQEKSMKGMVCGMNSCTYWPHFIPTVLLGLYFMVLVCLNYLVLWTPLKEEEHRDKNMDGMFMVSLFLASLAFFNLLVTPISGMAAVKTGTVAGLA